MQRHFRRGGLPESVEVGQCTASRNEAQAPVVLRQALEQRGDALILEFARRGRSGRVLQRFESVENEQVLPLADDAGEALAFLERAGAAGGECLVRVVAEVRSGLP